MATRETKRIETRRRIYEAALGIFRRDGVVAARTEDIATAARVSRGAFYFHFPTKEHVLLERMHETEAEICGALAALPPAAPIDRVLASVNESLAIIWEPDPKLLPDLVGAALRFTALTMHDRQATPLRSALAQRFCDAAERGELTGKLPPETLGDVYLANTLGGLLAWYGNPSLPLRSVLDAVTFLFWSGAASTPAPARAAKKKTMAKKTMTAKKTTTATMARPEKRSSRRR